MKLTFLLLMICLTGCMRVEMTSIGKDFKAKKVTITIEDVDSQTSAKMSELFEMMKVWIAGQELDE